MSSPQKFPRQMRWARFKSRARRRSIWPRSTFVGSTSKPAHEKKSNASTTLAIGHQLFLLLFIQHFGIFWSFHLPGGGPGVMVGTVVIAVAGDDSFGGGTTMVDVLEVVVYGGVVVVLLKVVVVVKVVVVYVVDVVVVMVV